MACANVGQYMNSVPHAIDPGKSRIDHQERRIVETRVVMECVGTPVRKLVSDLPRRIHPKRPMHSLCVFSAALLALACAPAHAFIDRIFDDGFQQRVVFQIQSPSIPIAAGDAQTYCYFFSMPTGATTGVKWWVSHMGAGMQHAILFATQTAAAPDGTVTNQSPCGTFPGGQAPKWLYATYHADEDLVFPTSDDAGHPLALTVAAGQPAFLQIYLVNSTAQPLSPSIAITAEAIDPAQPYTTTAAYMTFNTDISIPSDGTNYQVQNTCPVPGGEKFWWLSTRTHHFAVQAKVSDGGTDLVSSEFFNDPAFARFAPPAFYAFTNGLTATCTYDNLSGSVVMFGDSESTNEVCMAIGYFFPAPTGGEYCVNNTGPF